MDHFEYRNGQLCCEGLTVEQLARQFGTPLYVYSAKTLRDHYRRLVDAFAPVSPTICFSIKCLPNVHVLQLLKQEGAGFDVTSGGELHRALTAGGGEIVFAGVGKTDDEIRAAIDADILAFNIESEQEFENLSRLAAEAGKTIHAALRVNPDVYDPKTHAKTTTGKKETKFGVDVDRARQFFATYGRDEHVRVDGIHIHIGSPIYSPDPYVFAIQRTLDLIDGLRTEGHEVSLLDIGGGYAADYEQGASPTSADYAEHLVPLLKDKGLRIVLEPGRSIACNAGILLGRVLYRKKGGSKSFAIVDAAMTDLIRPTLYDGQHFIYPAKLPAGAAPPVRQIGFVPQTDHEVVDIVGGVCETGDFLGKDRRLPPLSRGDLLAVFSAGAYGFAMSSQYNSRPRAAEVLVEGNSARLIRRRETYDDLLAPELEAKGA